MEARLATADEIKAAQGQPPALLPLGLDMHSCATQEEMNTNIYETFRRGYQSILPYLGKFSGKASIVGSGPSIEKTYTELTGDILAVNQSLRVLLEKGVVPKFVMLWDAAEIVEQFAIPHPEVTYLVASRCHPKVFERLKDCKVIVWHAGGDHNIQEVLEKEKVMEPMINGGSAGVTRGIFLLTSLGYKDIHIFGADSSYSDDGRTHVFGSLVKEKDMMISVGNNPAHWFRTTPEWCAQVMEYRTIYAMFTVNGWAEFTCYGDGMFQFMHSVLEAKRKALSKEDFLAQITANEVQSNELNKAASEMLNPQEEAHACQ